MAHLLNEGFLKECYYRLGRDRASGMDGVSWEEYGEQLDENIADLVARMKAKQYKPQPSRRVYIRKDEHSKRPLGLPALEDKIVQKGVAWILEAIYEQDFLNCSYGFRPGRSCHQALGVVDRKIMKRPIHYVVEADVTGFFDNVSHEWMMRFLKVRIQDPSLLLLIQRFLKVGYVDAEHLVLPDRGTPQGGNLSPILSNIFLHYVLDLWFTFIIRPRVHGECYLVRYADDFLCLVQRKGDAQSIEKTLRERFAKFHLTLHPEKTRVIHFGRSERVRTRCSKRQSHTFDFLGSTHYWGRSRRGYPILYRETSSKRFRRACKELTAWLKTVRSSAKVKEWWPVLQAKLRGHYQYYGISGNSPALGRFADVAKQLIFKWLNRRSQKVSFNWPGFRDYLRHYPLPKPRIVHRLYAPSTVP